MTFVLYTNSVSAHQIPLAHEIVKRIGADAFRYVYCDESKSGNQEIRLMEPWITKDAACVETCDVLLVGGIRPIDLLERRLRAGQTTLYMSERWFKPIPIGCFWLPGVLKMLHPGYWRMARRFASLFGNANFRYLPIGKWAESDMRLLCRLQGKQMSSSRVINWGDFVSRSELAGRQDARHAKAGGPLRILWIGRMIPLKRVDTLIKAVAHLKGKVLATLTLVGDGSDKERLVRLAQGMDNVFFLPPTDLRGVRKIMRGHDVFAFCSNGFEGWGAVVPEALEEGMRVLGTYEAGASASILPESNLFHCGDWKTLARKLSGEIPPVEIGAWAVDKAAARLLKEVGLD